MDSTKTLNPIDKVDELIAPSLRKLLEDKDILKLGVSVGGAYFMLFPRSLPQVTNFCVSC